MMKMMKGFLLTTLIVASSIGWGQAANDAAVATVNGTKITKFQLEQAYKENMMFVSNKVVNKEKVLNDLINRELGIAKAKQAKYDQDPVVKRKMEDVLYHAQISKDLEQKLSKINVTEKEVESYYKTHQEYRVAHILFRVKATPDKKESEEALDQAMRVYKTLQENPDKFTELANKFSQSSVAPIGGDMGFVPAANMAPEFFTSIKDKAIGHITSPVRTQFGYHVIKVLGVKEYKQVSLPFYQKVVYDIKRDDILQQYFKDLKKNASISINNKLLE
jgi:peptidyl-prolyl cis-trans isomerase C